MPEICRFFGIVIRMYYDEHEPPHFHAIYSGMEVQIGINPIVKSYKGTCQDVHSLW